MREVAIVGFLTLGALVLSDYIEGTNWYAREMWEGAGVGANEPPREKWAGYLLRYGAGILIVAGGTALLEKG